MPGKWVGEWVVQVDWRAIAEFTLLFCGKPEKNILSLFGNSPRKLVPRTWHVYGKLRINKVHHGQGRLWALLEEGAVLDMVRGWANVWDIGEIFTVTWCGGRRGCRSTSW